MIKSLHAEIADASDNLQQLNTKTSECMLHPGVLCLFVLFCVFVFVRAILSGSPLT